VGRAATSGSAILGRLIWLIPWLVKVSGIGHAAKRLPSVAAGSPIPVGRKLKAAILIWAFLLSTHGLLAQFPSDQL